MKFDFRKIDDVQIIIINGEMVGGPDATLLSEKIREYIDRGENKIIIDMKNVNWMNSSGLGILIGGLSTVRNHGGDLKLIHLRKKPQELLKITKLDKVFQIFEREDEALASFE